MPPRVPTAPSASLGIPPDNPSSRSTTFLIAAYYLLNLLLCGVYAPWERLEMHAAIARDLHGIDPASPLLAHGYYLEAPLHFLLAHALGATARLPYLIYCAALVLLGYALFLWLGRRRWGEGGLLLMGVLLVAHPITYILHTWLGLADGITFVLSVAALLSTSAPLFGLVAFLGLLNHPMVALVLGGVIALRWERRELGWRHAVWALAGLATGRAAAWWWLQRTSLEVTGRLEHARALLDRQALLVNVDWLPLLVYSFYFALIVPLVVAWPGMWSERRRYTAVYLATQLAYAVVAAVTWDKTRVFALLSWAPTLHFLATAAALHADRIEAFLTRHRTRRGWWTAPLLALVLPHYFVTGDGGLWAPGFFFVWRHLGSLLGF